MINPILSLATVAFFSSYVPQVAGHMAMWSPSMYGFGDSYEPVTPLANKPFDQWVRPLSRIELTISGSMGTRTINPTRSCPSLRAKTSTLKSPAPNPTLHSATPPTAMDVPLTLGRSTRVAVQALVPAGPVTVTQILWAVPLPSLPKAARPMSDPRTLS